MPKKYVAFQISYYYNIIQIFFKVKLGFFRRGEVQTDKKKSLRSSLKENQDMDT